MQLNIKEYFAYTVIKESDWFTSSAICLCRSAYVAEEIARNLTLVTGYPHNVIKTVVENEDMDSEHLRHGLDDAVISPSKTEVFPKWKYWEAHDFYFTGEEDYTTNWKEVEE